MCVCNRASPSSGVGLEAEKTAGQIIFGGTQAPYSSKSPGRQEAGWVAEIQVHLLGTLQGKELPTHSSGGTSHHRQEEGARAGRTAPFLGRVLGAVAGNNTALLDGKPAFLALPFDSGEQLKASGPSQSTPA